MIKPFSLLLPLCALCALCVSTPRASAQDLTGRGKEQPGPVAIINAVVHPVSGPAIEGGFVAFDKGVITAIGPGDAAARTVGRDGQGGWRVIDAAGKHVYPGLIGARTQVGLEEMNAIRPSRDTSETGQVTPEVRACSAVNPDSTLIPVARSNGVLLAGVFPSGGLIPGRASVIRLDGWTHEQMTVLDDAGMVVSWPQARPIVAWWMDKSEEDQRKDIQRSRRTIEDTLDAAAAYAKARDGDTSPAPTRDVRMEAMRGLFTAGAVDPAWARPAGMMAVKERRPLMVWANDYDQIQAAVLACAERGLRCVIVGGRDGPQCADLLQRHGVPVIVDGTIRFPKRDDAPYDDAFTLPSRLAAAGVRFCIASGDETAHERNLPYSAALAAAYGLDREAALRSITLSAAEVLGIDARYGSLDVGKSATLSIADGDILEVTTNVKAAFIDGREVDLMDKQKVLEKRYREKYPETRGK